MNKRISILSTKKLSSEQKQALLDADFDVIDENFIETKTKDFSLKNVSDNLIFTSQNAVQSVLKNPESTKLKDKTVFCVGSKTKALLEQNGFTVEAHTGYASDLAEIISLIYSDKTYTFFSGNLRRDTLPEMLKESGVKFNEIEVYETILTPKKMTGNFDAIMFFSPSGVKSYLSKNSISKEICFAIGETTAEALENKKVKNIMVAYKPTVEDLITEVIQEYK